MNEPTERQLQIARLINDGMNIPEAAAHLGVHPNTVKNAMLYLRKKLGVEKTRHVGPALRERGML